LESTDQFAPRLPFALAKLSVAVLLEVSTGGGVAGGVTGGGAEETDPHPTTAEAIRDRNMARPEGDGRTLTAWRSLVIEDFGSRDK
jgi:hypothetical protein